MLGGGPSLDQVLPWLQEQRRHLVVLAAGRISGRLRSLGISPDFVMTADPHPGSFDNSREALTFWREAVLIHAEYACAPLISQWRGRSFYFGKRFDWQTPLNGKAVITAGPTVSNFAVDIAVRLGFRRILLAGVDFCYSQSGITHAQGSQEHVRGAVVGKNLSVETNEGGSAETSNDFMVARDEMAKLAGRARKQGCRIINLAPGAARVSGVAHQPLAEITFRNGDDNPSARVIGALAPEDGSSRQAHYRRMLTELKRARQNLLQLHELFKAVELWREEKRLGSVKKGLSQEQQAFYDTVMDFGAIPLQLARASADPENGSAAEDERLVESLCAVFAGSTRELLAEIDIAEQGLATRLQEEQEFPDFGELAARWRAGNQPGRILLWEDRFPERAGKYSAPEEELVRGLKDEFAALMAGTTLLGAGPSEKTFNPKEMRAIILDLGKKKDRAGLERVEQALSGYQNAERGIFMALARAQLAELAGADEPALADYRLIAEAGQSEIQEDALSRITVLKIKVGDLSGALEALESLCHLSPAYVPRYAEALAAVGAHEQALEVYAAYLDENPADIAVMLRLGRYYQELDHSEGARFILGHVLKLEPDNQAAAALLAGLS